MLHGETFEMRNLRLFSSVSPILIAVFIISYHQTDDIGKAMRSDRYCGHNFLGKIVIIRTFSETN